MATNAKDQPLLEIAATDSDYLVLRIPTTALRGVDIANTSSVLERLASLLTERVQDASAAW